MALISPELYDSGLKAIELIKQGREMAKPHPHQQLWPSHLQWVAKSLSTELLHHIEMQGGPTHYDLLVSAGPHTKSELSVPEWGFICLIGLEMCGSGWKGVLSSVGDWSGGERVCVVPLHEGQVHECPGGRSSQLA